MRALIRFVLGFFVLAASPAAWSQSQNQPIGNADFAGPASGSYVVRGWTCDPDDYNLTLWLHFYLDGTYDTGTFVGATGADGYRGDVGYVCGGTVYHGFNFTIPSQYLPPGQHTIYSYAIDNGGVGPNPLLGALTFTVSGAPPAASPNGSADWAGASGSGYATSGWTCDTDDYGLTLWLHFYLDGNYATGTFVGAAPADMYRGDLAYACNGNLNHGYNFTIPSQYLATAGTHSIYAYAQDNTGAAPATLLGPLSFVVTNGQTPNAPYGWLENIVPSGNAFVASGWTCDADNWGMSLQVQFYADGPSGSGVYLGSTTADAQRYDIASGCGNVAAHGFNFTFPSMAPGTHSLYVYAVDNGNVTSAPLSGTPGYFTVPTPPRTDLLFGYYFGCRDDAASQAGHMNLWWATGCGDEPNTSGGTGVWHTDMANELQSARAAGATSVVLHLWPEMVFGQGAQAYATSEFQQLADSGQLSGFSSIMIYPIDEPDQNGASDATMTSALQMLRGVIAGIPQLAQAKFGVIYNCRTTGRHAPYDWIGCDDYDVGCDALGELTTNFPLGAGQSYMIVPGGADPWRQDPACFTAYAQNNSNVVAVVPFLWMYPDRNPTSGISGNGMRSAYCQAGRTLTGRPGAC